MRAEGMGIKGFVWGTARSVLILEVFFQAERFHDHCSSRWSQTRGRAEPRPHILLNLFPPRLRGAAWVRRKRRKYEVRGCYRMRGAM